MPQRRPSLLSASCVTSVVHITDGFPEIFQEIEPYRSAARSFRGKGRTSMARRTSEEESLTGKLSSLIQPAGYLYPLES